MAAAGVPVVPGQRGAPSTTRRGRASAGGRRRLSRDPEGGGGRAAASAWRGWPDEPALAGGVRDRHSGEPRPPSAPAALFVERYLERAAPRRGAGVRRRARRASCTCTSASARSSAGTRSSIEEIAGARAVRRDRRRGSRRPRWRGARAVGYVNAGTMEFIVQGERVLLPRDEHPAAGRAPGHRGGDGRRPRRRPSSAWRRASRCRGRRTRSSSAAPPSSAAIYAEDPAKNFLPSPGTITRLDAARGPGDARSSAGSRRAAQVSVHYDPLLAKLVAPGRDPRRGHRADAGGAGRLRRRGRADDRHPVPPARARERGRSARGRRAHPDGRTRSVQCLRTSRPTSRAWSSRSPASRATRWRPATRHRARVHEDGDPRGGAARGRGEGDPVRRGPDGAGGRHRRRPRSERGEADEHGAHPRPLRLSPLGQSPALRRGGRRWATRRSTRDMGKHWSVPTLKGMFAHIYGADTIWLTRWKGASPTGFPAMPTSRAWPTSARSGTRSRPSSGPSWTGSTRPDLARVVEYKNTEGAQFRVALGRAAPARGQPRDPPPQRGRHHDHPHQRVAAGHRDQHLSHRGGERVAT